MADRRCPAVEWVEVRPIERPAASRHPVTSLEIDGVERAAPPGPNRSGSAVATLARFSEIEVRRAGALSHKKRLSSAIGPEATAFEETYAKRAVEKFPRQRDTGGTGAYDTHVGLDEDVVPEGAAVDDHAYYLSSMSALQTLLRGSIDYAGLFPPAGLDMGTAVRNYAAYRAEPDAWALGRFVLPASRLQEFESAATGRLQLAPAGQPWRLSVLAGPDLPADLELIANFGRRHSRAAGPDAVADTIEAKATSERGIEDIMRQAPPTHQVYIEIPIDRDPFPLLQAIKGAGGRAKVRTGGVTPEAFPSPEDLLRFLRGSVQAGVAFKATAGLHHPLRAEYPLTYETRSRTGPMFGFLNLFLATALFQAGESDSKVARLLEEGSPGAFGPDEHGISWNGCRFDLDALSRVRAEGLVSIGSCSFTEPLSDLAALHLLPTRVPQT